MALKDSKDHRNMCQVLKDEDRASNLPISERRIIRRERQEERRCYTKALRHESRLKLEAAKAEAGL